VWDVTVEIKKHRVFISVV